MDTIANAAEVSMKMAVGEIKELPGYSQGEVGDLIFMSWSFNNCLSSLVGDHRCQTRFNCQCISLYGTMPVRKVRMHIGFVDYFM